MRITVIVRSGVESEPALTFDGMQRVVIGRGAGSDVRLPDPSVSHRHACLHAEGADFVLTDEGSTNGTFVGEVKVAARTWRTVRSGDKIRVGRVWLELRLDQKPATRDLAAATREIALAIVSRALEREGKGITARVLVVEGPDRGASMSLGDDGRPYVLGRGEHCDLPLSDPDASREHASVTRRSGIVAVRDLGAKNGTRLGESRVSAERDMTWRPAQMVRIGRTVLALEEPLGEALVHIEGVPDEALGDAEPIEPLPVAAWQGAQTSQPPDNVADRSRAPAPHPSLSVKARVERLLQRRPRPSITDVVVFATALGVLAASLVCLVWLLRG